MLAIARDEHTLALQTVNEPADMKELIARGLDGLCTDRPDLLAKALKT